MSDCPAYLAVTITDLLLYDELFRYDLLVLCPSTFSVSFRFPSSSSSSSTPRDPMTSSFDVHLSDAVRSQRVYLTHVDSQRLIHSDDDRDERSQAIVFHRRVGASTSSSWDHSMVFHVVQLGPLGAVLRRRRCRRLPRPPLGLHPRRSTRATCALGRSDADSRRTSAVAFAYRVRVSAVR